MTYTFACALTFFIVVTIAVAALRILIWRPKHSAKPPHQRRPGNAQSYRSPSHIPTGPHDDATQNTTDLQAISTDPLDDPAQVERVFRSVFAIMTEERRSALLDGYMHDGDVHAAMKLARLDRQRDETRFD
jgi:hypothetical protein